MDLTRRALLGSTLAATALAAAARSARGAEPEHLHDHAPDPATPPPEPAPTPAPTSEPTPAPAPTTEPDAHTPTRGRVIVPNGATLPYEVRNGVKVYHLVAEPVRHQIAPGLDIDAWGYNGRTPGPLIEAVHGDRVRIYVTNKLPERTTVHWHGMLVPNGMDGVAGLTQEAIAPGQTFKYEFVCEKPGTFMYHPHFDEMTQIALGMVGMIVVHPKGGAGRVDRDYAMIAHEWKIPIGTRRPDALTMSDFNVLTFNSKAFPATDPLVAESGERVRIRLANIGPMDHHPLHLHGHYFHVTDTDGGPVPASARWPETTVLVPTGAVRVIELTAGREGDWPFHCHMTHHVMNQMGHHAVNLIGADVKGVDKKLGKAVPGYMTMGQDGMGDMMQMRQPKNSISMRAADGPFGNIEMGGMFTLLKVRRRLSGDGDPGWYAHPPGSIAREASADDLARDGIRP